MQISGKKIVDSSEDISKGGRAEKYWLGRVVKRSNKYEIENNSQTGKLDPYLILKRYKLKGFEFGNWVNNNDRYDRLFAIRDSLLDLSKIIGSKNIGLDNTIGIAVGARGQSKALAHFEPNTFMINLTKEKGHGALAHEYGHALDYFFGTFVDQSFESSALSGGHFTTRKAVTSGGKFRVMMNDLINSAIMEKGQLSESYKKWIENVGRASEYWFRRNEIFARIFEQWVDYQAKKKGIKNTFLHKKKYDATVYLTKKDFLRILPKMNKLIKEMAKEMNK